MHSELTALAAAQHGLLARHQLRHGGIDYRRLRRWIERGRLEQVHRNVFAIAGTPPTPRRGVMAAVLQTGADATVSHGSAASLWGIAGFPLTPLHLVVTRRERHHGDLPWRVHQFTDLPHHHRREIDAIPVTSPALTMLHLASSVGRTRFERALDSAWSLRLLTGKDLEEVDRELAVQGRNGVVALREAAARRGQDWTPPQSNLESRFMSLLDSHGHLGFERQAWIREGRWSARVDFLHRESKTIVEVQSERYHTALTDAEADRDRREKLETAGFHVVEVWDDELFQQPDLVIDRVTEAVNRAA